MSTEYLITPANFLQSSGLLIDRTYTLVWKAYTEALIGIMAHLCNFKNLKSEFYPSENTIKTYLKTGKVVRKNNNGPWSGYKHCTQKLLEDRETLQRTLSAVDIPRKVSKTPWARNYAPDVPVFRSKEVTPKWSKVSNGPPEEKYEKWQNERLKNRGMDRTKPFFKNRLSASMSEFAHMPRLEPEEYARRAKKDRDEYLARKNYKRGDFGVSWESPNWFKTDTNGKLPDRSFKTLTYAGKQTLLKVKTPRDAPQAEISLLNDRTARQQKLRERNHNMKKTEITEYVNACVRTRVAIWKS